MLDGSMGKDQSELNGTRIYGYILVHGTSWKHRHQIKAMHCLPKIRWEDDVRKDIQKLKVPNWKILVQDRRRWKELVERAKTLNKEL
jgi:hypothetical protein